MQKQALKETLYQEMLSEELGSQGHAQNVNNLFKNTQPRVNALLLQMVMIFKSLKESLFNHFLKYLLMLIINVYFIKRYLVYLNKINPFHLFRFKLKL